MPRLLLCLPLLAGLAACGASPQALGLTGAPQPTPPKPPGDNAIAAPGLPQDNGLLGPDIVPMNGNGRYYGY